MGHGAVAMESLARWFGATASVLQGTRRGLELAFLWQSNEAAVTFTEAVMAPLRDPWQGSCHCSPHGFKCWCVSCRYGGYLHVVRQHFLDLGKY
jgi:hypothetical protein